MYNPLHTVFDDFKSDKSHTAYLAVKKMGVANLAPVGMVLDRYHPIGDDKPHHYEQTRRILSQLEKEGKVISIKLSELTLKRLIDSAKRKQKKLIKQIKSERGITVDPKRAELLLQQEIRDLRLEFTSDVRGDPTIYMLSDAAREAEGISKPPGTGRLEHSILGNYFLLHITEKYGRDWFTHTLTEHEITTTNFVNVRDSSGIPKKVNDFYAWQKLADCFVSLKDAGWHWVEVENSEKPSKERKIVASIRPRIGQGNKVSHLHVVGMIIVHGYKESARWMLDSLEEHSLSRDEKYLAYGTTGIQGFDEEQEQLKSGFESEGDFASYIHRTSPNAVLHYFMSVTKRLAVTKHINKFYFWHPLSYRNNECKREDYLSIVRIREIERELGWASPMTRKKRYLADLID